MWHKVEVSVEVKIAWWTADEKLILHKQPDADEVRGAGGRRV